MAAGENGWRQQPHVLHSPGRMVQAAWIQSKVSGGQVLDGLSGKKNMEKICGEWKKGYICIRV
jgi:hypothetical protein